MLYSVITALILALHATASPSTIFSGPADPETTDPEPLPTIYTIHKTTLVTATTTTQHTKATSHHGITKRDAPTATDPAQCTPSLVPYFGDVFSDGCQGYLCLSSQPRSLCPTRPLPTPPPFTEPTAIVQTYSWTTVTRAWDWASRVEDCTIETVPYLGWHLRNGCQAVGKLEDDTLALGPSSQPTGYW